MQATPEANSALLHYHVEEMLSSGDLVTSTHIDWQTAMAQLQANIALFCRNFLNSARELPRGPQAFCLQRDVSVLLGDVVQKFWPPKMLWSASLLLNDHQGHPTITAHSEPSAARRFAMARWKVVHCE
ncbi:hypothetical protein NDN08_007237 [Rhodosorus marinus]|uniref:Uncharacterized protein n=1 Tax=Rhodosorus marinus TaxID=101924 RepID=A0AAV8UL85_9RHOD|nr:hypothetical protein NDN08_007237 [Rhodosorus marinus]